MNKTVLVASIFLLASWFAACDFSNPQVSINDVQKSEEITLQKATNQGNIYALRIHLSGKLDGEAKVALLANAHPYRVETIHNQVNLIWEGDWYADKAVIRYEPVSVKSGRISIRYRFSGL